MNPYEAAEAAREEHRAEPGSHDIWPTFNGGWLCTTCGVTYGSDRPGYRRIDEEGTTT